VDIRKGRHVVYILHAHLVFVHQAAGEGLRCGTPEAPGADIPVGYSDFEVDLVEFNGEAHHVHLLVNYPPKVRLSELVNKPQGSLLPAAEAGVPGDLDALERAQEQGASMAQPHRSGSSTPGGDSGSLRRPMAQMPGLGVQSAGKTRDSRRSS